MSKHEILHRALASPVDDIITGALQSVRMHLGMEIAYLSEFVDGQSIFRAVSAPGLESLIKPGDSRPLEEVYCNHIIAGRLPELMADTAGHPLAVSLPITSQTPIGAHVSVPIRRADGTVYGMFCCLSPHPNPSLNQRDLEVMRMFADLAQRDVQRHMTTHHAAQAIRDSITALIDGQGYRIVLQPIVDLATGHVSGFEALSRFESDPYRSPDKWFRDAGQVGLQQELEITVLHAALSLIPMLPPESYLSLNASVETIGSGAFRAALAGQNLGRIVLELTEQMAVNDFDKLVGELTLLRAAGTKLAIDDAGAGYAGLQQIVRLRPDIIKLDMSLTKNIDSDRALRSLGAAMVHFSTETDAILVAEGIETAEELTTLRGLGVHRGQGYFIGRPGDPATVLSGLAQIKSRIMGSGSAP